MKGRWLKKQTPETKATHCDCICAHVEAQNCKKFEFSYGGEPSQAFPLSGIDTIDD